VIRIIRRPSSKPHPELRPGKSPLAYNDPVRFEWDPDKAAHNLDKHGVTFEEAQAVFEDDLFVVFDDPDHSDYEKRYLIMGQSREGRLLVVSYTERSRHVRLISARPATRREPESL